MRTNYGQNGTEFGQIVPIAAGVDNITSPDGALEHARAIARRLVSLRTTDTKTQEIALFELTREYRFGSFLEKLVRSSTKPTVHLHLYTRLVRALAKEVEAQKQRIAHLEHTLEIINGGPSAGHDVAPQPMAAVEASQTNQAGGA